MDGTTHIAWIYGLAKIAVYGENAFTTIKFTINYFPLVTIRSVICLSSITIFPLNPISGVLYFVRFSAFKRKTFYKSKYIILAPLP